MSRTPVNNQNFAEDKTSGNKIFVLGKDYYFLLYRVFYID